MFNVFPEKNRYNLVDITTIFYIPERECNKFYLTERPYQDPEVKAKFLEFIKDEKFIEAIENKNTSSVKKTFILKEGYFNQKLSALNSEEFEAIISYVDYVLKDSIRDYDKIPDFKLTISDGSFRNIKSFLNSSKTPLERFEDENNFIQNDIRQNKMISKDYRLFNRRDLFQLIFNYEYCKRFISPELNLKQYCEELISFKEDWYKPLSNENILHKMLNYHKPKEPSILLNIFDKSIRNPDKRIWEKISEAEEITGSPPIITMDDYEKQDDYLIKLARKLQKSIIVEIEGPTGFKIKVPKQQNMLIISPIASQKSSISLNIFCNDPMQKIAIARSKLCTPIIITMDDYFTQLAKELQELNTLDNLIRVEIEDECSSKIYLTSPAINISEAEKSEQELS